MLIAFYLLLALLVGVLGRDRAIGFAGFFVLSLVLTPVLSAVLLLLTAPRAPHPSVIVQEPAPPLRPVWGIWWGRAATIPAAEGPTPDRPSTGR